MRRLALAGLIVAACGGSGSTVTTAAGSTSPAVEQNEKQDTTTTLETPVATNPAGQEAFVVHVDDGDSIIVEIDGRDERVRLIGINAPERDECLGDESRQMLANHIESTTVLLESDVEDADQFDRLLRYVWLDGVLINELMAERGLVVAREYEPNITRQAALAAAQESAKDANVGLWAAEACGAASGVTIRVLAIQADPDGRDDENLNGEFVIFENKSASDADLSGFVLRDGSSSNRYTIPDGFTVPGNGRFVVFVGCGDDTDVELYWCSDSPIWSNDGDDVILTDPTGNVVVHETY